MISNKEHPIQRPSWGLALPEGTPSPSLARIFAEELFVIFVDNSFRFWWIHYWKSPYPLPSAVFRALAATGCCARNVNDGVVNPIPPGILILSQNDDCGPSFRPGCRNPAPKDGKPLATASLVVSSKLHVPVTGFRQSLPE